jgi:type I restriction enzyme, S subunit
MTLETLFEKFDELADAPDAVAKMRELVLELAAQGKLVGQDPADGTGHVLLNEILREKSPSDLDAEAETMGSASPNIPSSWAASKLGDVAEIIRGVSFPGSAKSETRLGNDVACLRTASVQAEIDWDDLIFISPTHVSRSDQWVAPNDIMISMANSYALVGKVAIVRQVPQKATFGAFLAAIRPVQIEPYFLLYVLRSPRMQAAFRESSSQTTNIANISLGRMRPLPFPLPPLAEQKRIVAKVDELMALCDRLEEQQQEREKRHAVLSRAALARFADAPTATNLDLLFHSSYSIDPGDVRESILALAVRGKLVSQDPQDGPAQSLIEEISELRAQPSTAGRAKASRASSRMDESRRGHEIPMRWTWCRLADLVLEFRYGTSRKCSRQPNGVPVLRIPNLKDGRIDSRDLKFTAMPTSEFEDLRLREGDLLLVRSNGSESLVGRSAVASAQDEGFAYAGYLVRARMPKQAVFARYVHLALSTPAVRTQIEGPIRTTSGVKNINTTELANLVFPLPPLAEQRRIVARVEQLMALVDRLEAQQAASRAAAVNLLDAVVAELSAKE